MTSILFSESAGKHNYYKLIAEYEYRMNKLSFEIRFACIGLLYSTKFDNDIEQVSKRYPGSTIFL